jgi:hypothetical protein
MHAVLACKNRGYFWDLWLIDIEDKTLIKTPILNILRMILSG